MASFAKVVSLLLLSQVVTRKFKVRSKPGQVEQDEPAEHSASEATEKVLAVLAKVHGSMAEVQMRDLDKDEDGALSLAEFVDYLESDFKKDFYTVDKDLDGKISVMELEAYNIWKGDGMSWRALMQGKASNTSELADDSSELADMNFTGADDLNLSDATKLNASNSGVRTWWGDLCRSMYPAPSRSFLMCYIRYGWVQSTCWKRSNRTSNSSSSSPGRFPEARCIRNQMRIFNTIHSQCYRSDNIQRYRACFGWQLTKRARLRSIDKIHKKCRRAGKFHKYRTCFHQKLNLTILHFDEADGNDSNDSAFMDGLTSLEEYDEEKMELSEETKKETKKRFDSLDEKGDGHISQSKGAKLMEESPTAERQMQDLDEDEDGALSLAEFVNHVEFAFKEDFYTADTDHDGKINVAELETHNNGGAPQVNEKRGGMSLVALRQRNRLNSSGVAAVHSSEAANVNSSEAAELNDSNAGVRAWWRGMCKNMYPRRLLIRRKCYYRYRRVEFSCLKRRPIAKPKCFMGQMRISDKIHKECRGTRNMMGYRKCFRRQVRERNRRLISRARRLIIDKIHKSCRRFGNMGMYLKCLAKLAASNL